MIQQHSRRFLDTALVAPSDKRIHYPQRVGVSTKGMVASQHHLATEAGRTLLAAGGNAVDAAVAVAFALGVVEPAASGLGGQTMLTLHVEEAGRTFCLDGGNRAPNRTPPGGLERAEQLRGHRATTVPSTPAVLFHALKHYGTKSLPEALAQIPWPVERQPLDTTFGDAEVFTFGPPGAGRTLIEAINLLEHFPELPETIDTPRGVLLLAHIIRKANIDRTDRPADPTLFAQELELDEDITHKDYAARAARRIHHRIKSSGETTHLSTIDVEGNMVALTQSIERVYGSFSASPKLGFLYNNYMSAFEYRDITHPYYLRPNAVPWASVAPTILLKKGSPWLSIGSPGSERIVSAVLQVLLRLFRGDTPYNAVEAPRMHASIKGKVSMEGTRMRSDIGPMLSRHGFDLQVRDPYSFYLGSIQLVMREGGEFLGVADPRRDGSAEGPV